MQKELGERLASFQSQTSLNLVALGEFKEAALSRLETIEGTMLVEAHLTPLQKMIENRPEFSVFEKLKN